MTRAVTWPGANKVLGPPQGMDETQVSNLPIFTNGVTCVSCWELSDEALAEIIRTKRVFISIFSGQTQPPVYVGSEDEVRDLVSDYGVWPKAAS